MERVKLKVGWEVMLEAHDDDMEQLGRMSDLLQRMLKAENTMQRAALSPLPADECHLADLCECFEHMASIVVRIRASAGDKH